MLDFNQAQHLLAEAGASVSSTQNVTLAQASGRILACNLNATVDIPPADNSAMDGYAIRHADYQEGVSLPIQQRCYAGDIPEALRPGYAIRLFTGSLIPEGADTVVIQENTQEADNHVSILHAPRIGQHIRKRGEDTLSGKALLNAGAKLKAAHITLLASQGLAQVPVYARLRIGVVTTGDELVHPGAPRAEQQIYNSNGPMLTSLIEGTGAKALHVLHARDNEADLRLAFTTLLNDCDLIFSVGGVSVGERDLVKPVLESLGGNLALWKVKMKPGKPVALTHIQGKPVVCLPGNPVSAYAVFAMLATPLIRHMQGRSELYPPILHLPLRTKKTRQDSREEFLRVQCRIAPKGNAELVCYPHQGSGVISSMPWASGLARLAADTPIHDGDIVPYYDLHHWLS
jgi:molybdopterin molybdotransferase